jgi:hypothetical protein
VLPGTAAARYDPAMLFVVLLVLVLIGLLAGAAGAGWVLWALFVIGLFTLLCVIDWRRKHPPARRR